jgi:heme/copper-type cytochrome/quinol oxidase subunit 2
MEISTNLGNDIYEYVNSNMSPVILIITLLVIILYVTFLLSIETTSTIDTNTNVNTQMLIVLLVAIFIFLVFVNSFEYFFGINIVATLKDVLTPKPKLDLSIHTTSILDDIIEEKPKPKPKIQEPEVFNIPGNNYNYHDAQALCKAYDAKLATYSQIEKAYKNGADWCNYGWSDNQMILYPTQKEKWQRLQKIEGHENDCGRPGINGGYMANPALKFGVNCYGIKPKISPKEEELMATQPLYPKTKRDIAIENRVSYWKNKLDEVLVAPFNHTSWSKY